MQWVSADEALAVVQSNDQVYCQGMASTPTGLLEALARRCQDLTNVKLYHLHLEGPTPQIAPHLKGRLLDISLFIGANLRQAVNQGQAYYLPLFLSDVPWFLKRPQCVLKACLIQVSPPDRHGFVSLGPTVEGVLAAMEKAQVVIAEVNPQVPRTLGWAHVPIGAIDYAVPVDRPLAGHGPTSGAPVYDRIAENVASLIPDRATLQVGIGKIPDAVLKLLGNHHDLGIHSEMISDGVMDLAEAGVVTGRYKGRDRDQIVTTFALGSSKLYRFMDDNPSIAMCAVDYTNSTAVIRQNPRMISINSALEVDITGQVGAESLGSRLISGVGGQMDFVRGASLAAEGRSIIALPSRTNTGIRRIVATLSQGAAVTTTRNHVQYVVTEHGIASLHGQTLDERARRLIAVADPKDRDELLYHASQIIPGF
ncbi:MAG: 4-hydroxybutyrate CoA-transferase [Thermaerobacter sp.]|nr:4-hydroxybutyrate CoA-transferase [Thermaerobacter sp.]